MVKWTYGQAGNEPFDHSPFFHSPFTALKFSPRIGISRPQIATVLPEKNKEQDNGTEPQG
jgi:hypothetical protein